MMRNGSLKKLLTPRNGVARLALALTLGTCLAAGPLVPVLSRPALADASLSDRLPSLAPVVDKVLPAVVNISVIQRAGGPDAMGEDESGNGDDQDQEQDQGQ